MAGSGRGSFERPHHQEWNNCYTFATINGQMERSSTYKDIGVEISNQYIHFKKLCELPGSYNRECSCSESLFRTDRHVLQMFSTVLQRLLTFDPLCTFVNYACWVRGKLQRLDEDSKEDHWDGSGVVAQSWAQLLSDRDRPRHLELCRSGRSCNRKSQQRDAINHLCQQQSDGLTVDNAQLYMNDGRRCTV